VGVPIGKPISNTKVYVVDEESELVAKGVRGELYIGGEGLGERVLEESGVDGREVRAGRLSGEAGKRLYRTGDLGGGGETGI